jgi:hypothetical protein
MWLIEVSAPLRRAQLFTELVHGTERSGKSDAHKSRVSLWWRFWRKYVREVRPRAWARMTVVAEDGPGEVHREGYSPSAKVHTTRHRPDPSEFITRRTGFRSSCCCDEHRAQGCEISRIGLDGSFLSAFPDRGSMAFVRQIAFANNRYKSIQVHVEAADGIAPHPNSSESEYGASWSPDTKRLATVTAISGF